MTQLPNPFYNPTASPVSTSVVPFTPPPQPQQIEIGGGYQNLGAAFSGFSQTLASFVANRVTKNREKEIEGGELKMFKSRKTMKEMVASGELDPVENPWEALGAASADGVLRGEEDIVKWKAEYEQRFRTDPNFSSSVSSFEGFINARISESISAGIDNPVWQRGYLKTVTSRVSGMAEAHNNNVVAYRRAKINDGLKVTIGSTSSDFLSEYKRTGGDMTPVAIDAYVDRLQPAFDEAVQTIGMAATIETMLSGIMEIRINSGDSHPLKTAVFGRIKSGTGLLKDTPEYRAVELKHAKQLEAARHSSDAGFAVDFIHKHLGEGGKMPGLPAFTGAIRSHRPDMSKEDIASYYSAGRAGAKSMVDGMLEDSDRRLIEQQITKVTAAYALTPGPDGVPSLSMDSGSVMARDPVAVEAWVRQGIINSRTRMGVPIADVQVENRVQLLIKQAKWQASKNILQQVSSRDMADPIRAQVLVNFSMLSGAPLAEAALFNQSYYTFQQNPQSKYANDVLVYGINLYANAKSVDALVKMGITEDAALFFQAAWAQQTNGRASGDALTIAASQVPASGGATQATSDFVGKLVKEINPEAVGSITQLISIEVTRLGRAASEAEKDLYVRNRLEQVITLPDDSIFIAPRDVSSRTQDLTNPDAVGLAVDSIKKVVMPLNPGVSGVSLQLNPTTGEYLVLLIPDGRTQESAVSPNFATAEALYMAGWPVSIRPELLAHRIRTKVIDEDARLRGLQSGRQTIEDARWGRYSDAALKRLLGK